MTKRTNNVLPLFDPETMRRVEERSTLARVEKAMQAADEAVARVRLNATGDEASRLIGAVKAVCAERSEWTPDDIWDHLLSSGQERPREPRLLGWAIRRALKDKWMVGTGEYRKSRRRHATPVPVYRSLKRE